MKSLQIKLNDCPKSVIEKLPIKINFLQKGNFGIKTPSISDSASLMSTNNLRSVDKGLQRKTNNPRKSPKVLLNSTGTSTM